MNKTSKPRLRALFPVLVLVGAALIGAGSPRDGSAQSAGDGAVPLRTAYQALLTTYIDPLTPAGLLGEAWVGMSGALAAEGLDAPPLPPLPDNAAAAWRAFEPTFRQMEAAARGTLNSRELAYAGIQSMTAARDECHTYFLPPDTLRDFLDELNGRQQFVGVGIRRSASPPYAIRQVFRDSPAERAGLRSGDFILAVDGTPTADLTSREVNERVRGSVGTDVTLRIERDGEIRDVTLTRAVVVVPALSAEVLPDGVGYIELMTFPSDTREAVDQIRGMLEDFEMQGVRGWILDLRFNTGGDPATALELLGLFLPPTEGYLEVQRAGSQRMYRTTGKQLAYQRPMAVLVGGDSASASELIAIVLQDTGRARIVGERTNGCLALGTLSLLPDGSGLVVTTSWLLAGPSRRDVNRMGLLPDEIVPAYDLPDRALSAAADYVKLLAARP
jgi:carboxyl-terminal processing protease